MLKVVGASWLQTKISSYILGLLGVLAILALFVGQMERIQEDGTYAATVFHSEKTGYHIELWGQSNNLAEIPRGVARAYLKMDYDNVGWSILEVETDGSYSDEVQAYAAGIVEGALTWYPIHNHLDNTIRARCDGTPIAKQCDKIKDALDRSVNTWRTYAADHEEDDPFWHHVSLHYTQINGILTGWRHGGERSMGELDTDISELYWLNSFSEIYEMQHKLNITVQDPTFDEVPTFSSSFLKIVNETMPDGVTEQKLFIAHNAAGSYTSMMRILKRYKLNYHMTSRKDSPSAPGVTVDFTGYPGAVTSQDEFYKTKGENHELAITGTTLKNYNSKLWKDVNITEQIPLGPRVTAANHLATNVSTWAHTLAMSNSGTGCKQWLIVDLNKFEQISNYTAQEKTLKASKDYVKEISISGRNKNIKHTVVHRGSVEGRGKGIVWLIEQVPSRTHSADITDALLEKSYWATFGLPIFKDISELTKTTNMQDRYGNIFSEEESPKSLIFRRGHQNATSVESIIKLMRYNNITAINERRNETISCTGDQIECLLEEYGLWSVLGVRADIVAIHREPFGVIDTKVIVSSTNSNKSELFAISSPPYNKIPAANSTNIPLNKGTLTSIYTDQFDDEPTIDGDEIRDMVKQQIEEERKEYFEELKKKTVQPFAWSSSDYVVETPKGIPDRWAFDPYSPQWAW